MRRARVATLIGLGIVLTGAAWADGFTTYVNPRFGVTAEVPSSWKSDPPPENGDGLIFRSRDNAASITVSGSLNIEDSPALAMKEQAKADPGETVSYRQIGRRSVTISGTNGGRIFYRKSLLVCRDQIWNNLSIDYPLARKADYDALVARVAGSLHFAGESGQVDDCR